MNALVITMIKIVAAMAVGFFLYKIRILNDVVNKGLSGLIVHVVSPCLIFTSIISMDDSQIQNALMLLWIGFAIYFALAILSFLVVKALRVPKTSFGVYQASMMFGNVGFLGLPLSEALFGPVGLFYMALLNIHLNLLTYSYGVFLVSGGGKKAKFSPKSLLNTGIISVLLAMIIYFIRIPVPTFITQPLSFLGSITSPLAMVVIGSTAAANSLRRVFSHKKLYLLTAIKMLALPILAFFILRMTLGNTLMTQVLTMYVGMPTAAIVGMFAITYDADAETAVSATTMMNIFCILTIPLLYLLMQLF